MRKERKSFEQAAGGIMTNKDACNMKGLDESAILDAAGKCVYCKPCNTWFADIANWRLHVETKPHKKKLASVGVLMKNRTVPAIPNNVKHGLVMFCNICAQHVPVAGCTSHVTGKKHVARVLGYRKSLRPVEKSKRRCTDCSVDIKENRWEEHKFSMSHAAWSMELELWFNRNAKKLSSRKRPRGMLVEQTTVRCHLCACDVPHNDWSSHIIESKHRTLADQFIRAPQPLPPYRNCYLCCVQVRKDLWDDHLLTIDHMERARTTPPPIPPPQMLRCGECDIECNFMDWNAHITSDKHIINSVKTSPLVECRYCKGSVPLVEWQNTEQLHPTSDSVCTKSTRCVPVGKEYGMKDIPPKILLWHKFHFCTVCCVLFQGKWNFNTIFKFSSRSTERFAMHLKTKDHCDNLKKLAGKGMELRHCDDCDLDVLPEHWDFHIAQGHSSVVSPSE